MIGGAGGRRDAAGPFEVFGAARGGVWYNGQLHFNERKVSGGAAVEGKERDEWA